MIAVKLCNHLQLNPDGRLICDWNNCECSFYKLEIAKISPMTMCGGYEDKA